MPRTNANLTVLIVDDSPAIRDYLVALLRQFGVQHILEAGNGFAALDQFERALLPIDLVFCDLAMPDMDGVETLRQLAARRLQTAVVVLSALDRRLMFTVADMAKNSGLHVLGTLPKPIDPDAVQGFLRDAQRDRPKTSGRVAQVSLEELDSALDEQRIEVQYQPKFRLQDGRMTGVEALARMRHPERGLLSAAFFVPLAETSGHRRISRLTLRVLRQAITEAGLWRKLGFDLDIAINLSMQTLRHVDLPEIIATCCRKAGVPTDRITLELTESPALDNLATLDIIARLRMAGFKLAMDDFGTGDSSLQRLKRLPFTELKIDRGFVDGAAEDEDMRAILSSSIDLGHRLRMNIVAEGVENADDWKLLEELSCDGAQGFLASRPLPPNQIPLFLQQWNSRLH